MASEKTSLFQHAQCKQAAGEPMAYEGQYPCPKCGGLRTGTNTIATSRRWILFICLDCKHFFRKASATVSSMSRGLRNLAEALRASDTDKEAR